MEHRTGREGGSEVARGPDRFVEEKLWAEPEVPESRNDGSSDACVDVGKARRHEYDPPNASMVFSSDPRLNARVFFDRQPIRTDAFFSIDAFLF
jgi:hypothetical protein